MHQLVGFAYFLTKKSFVVSFEMYTLNLFFNSAQLLLLLLLQYAHYCKKKLLALGGTLIEANPIQRTFFCDQLYSLYYLTIVGRHSYVSISTFVLTFPLYVLLRHKTID